MAAWTRPSRCRRSATTRSSTVSIVAASLPLLAMPGTGCERAIDSKYRGKPHQRAYGRVAPAVRRAGVREYSNGYQASQLGVAIGLAPAVRLARPALAGGGTVC